MRPIFFTKMEGTGNDFLIIDNRNNVVYENVEPRDLAGFVRKISNRKLGTGSDGVILVEQSKDFPFSMKYFNNDGSEAALCLNGARCVVSYSHRLGLIQEKGKFISASGPIGFYYKNGSVSVEVLPPVDIRLNFTLTVKRKKYKANYLKLGVPHCVIFVESYDSIDIEQIGRAIHNHKTFKPEGANVNFVKTKDDYLYIRSYERGIDNETLSCGSGVLASAYIAAKLFITESPVSCKTKGGELIATIGDRLYLEGSVNYICDGVYYLK